jgi:GH24 family phage-related lysozyme (muramidase)
MALKYWGVKSPGDGQFEDVLYEWLQSEGLSRHDPNHLKVAIEHFGCEDSFTTRATTAEMKAALDNGTPVIIHGYFTAFGHIVVLIGYNEKGFIVHDPYGEWTSNGYIRNDSSAPARGRAIVYSYGLIERACLPDGGCWAHFVTRNGVARPGDQTSIGPGTNTPMIATPEGGFRKFKPQELRLNSHSVKIIEHFEGLELHQYLCSAKVRTIGLGSTRWWNGEPIPAGATITKEQAVKLFTRDASEFIAAIQKLVDVPLTARQLAAVFSLCYNIGWQGFEESSVLKSINNRAGNDEIRTNLRKWSKAGGQALPGLLRRRNAEAMLWENKDNWTQAGFD